MRSAGLWWESVSFWLNVFLIEKPHLFLQIDSKSLGLCSEQWKYFNDLPKTDLDT